MLLKLEIRDRFFKIKNCYKVVQRELVCFIVFWLGVFFYFRFCYEYKASSDWVEIFYLQTLA